MRNAARTCSCGEVEIPTKEIPPGGEDAVLLHWKPIPGKIGPYTFAVQLQSNDPHNPNVAYQVMPMPLDDGLGNLSPLFPGNTSAALAVAQLNDDNMDGVVDDKDNLDLITADIGSNDATVFLGQGNGTFVTADGANDLSRPVFVAAVGLTGDIFPDLVAVNSGANALDL